MATFHLRNGFVSRGKGQSVVAAAAYQARARLYNEQDGLTKDYTRHHEQELLESAIYAPKDAPDWVFDRERLWNAAERAEDDHNKTRAKAARTAQRFEISLPHELSLEQNRRLLQDILRDNFTRKGRVCDVSIHGPHKEGDQRNIHAHVLVTMRTVNAQGFSAEKPHLSKAELREQVNHLRENVARQCSRHLERAGFKLEAARMIYAHKTLEEQQKIAEARNDLEHAEALKRAPTLHEGPTATQMKREGKGAKSWRVDFNQRLAAKRDDLRKMRAELAHVRETEERLAYANTPEGRQARLTHIHEWQRDKLDMQQTRARLQQQDAHAWARREDAAASPVLKAWRERDRARETAELERKQAEQREALLEKQTATTRQHIQRETTGEARPQPAPSFSYRPPRPAYWSERIRRARQSDAAREREEAAARYHERVMREQNTSHPPQAARPAGDIKPPHDPEAWWTDPKDRDPARPEPEPPTSPEPPRPISPAEAFEKLAQVRKAARTWREKEERRRAQEQERQPGRSIADDLLDGMLNKKDGPK